MREEKILERISLAEFTLIDSMKISVFLNLPEFLVHPKLLLSSSFVVLKY